MNILVPFHITSHALQYLQEHADTRYDPDLNLRPEHLLDALPWANGLIVRNTLQVRGSVLDALVSCSAIGRLGTGLDNIDVSGCRQRGIMVIPAIGQNSRSVAEYVVGMAFTLFRRTADIRPAMLSGAWPRQHLACGEEVFGKVHGIIGYGAAGKATAELSTAFGLHVVLCEHNGVAPSNKFPALPISELLEQSDVVSVHVPLTDETRGMLGGNELKAMKNGAVLINASRGGVVDEPALCDALQSGHLGGAAQDVFATEPLAANSPFNSTPNLILTPHIAGVTIQAEERVCDYVAWKMIEMLKTA